MLDRGRLRPPPCLASPATTHAAPRPRDGSTVPLTPRALDARMLARGPWPCRDGRAKHHSVPTAQTRRHRPPAASAPAARGPLDSRFAARRPVSPPPAMPPCRSDARRRGRSTHGLRARNATDTCASRFTCPPAHHRRPGATRVPGVRPTAWDEDGFRDGREPHTRRCRYMGISFHPPSRPPPPPRCNAGTWCTACRVGRGRLSRGRSTTRGRPGRRAGR